MPTSVWVANRRPPVGSSRASSRRRRAILLANPAGPEPDSYAIRVPGGRRGAWQALQQLLGRQGRCWWWCLGAADGLSADDRWVCQGDGPGLSTLGCDRRRQLSVGRHACRQQPRILGIAPSRARMY